jgi:hypothetical protein
MLPLRIVLRYWHTLLNTRNNHNGIRLGKRDTSNAQKSRNCELSLKMPIKDFVDCCDIKGLLRGIFDVDGLS